MTWGEFIALTTAVLLLAMFMLVIGLTGCTQTKHDTGWIAECKCLDCSFKCSRDYKRNKIELEK